MGPSSWNQFQNNLPRWVVLSRWFPENSRCSWGGLAGSCQGKTRYHQIHDIRSALAGLRKDFISKPLNPAVIEVGRNLWRSPNPHDLPQVAPWCCRSLEKNTQILIKLDLNWLKLIKIDKFQFLTLKIGPETRRKMGRRRKRNGILCAL